MRCIVLYAIAKHFLSALQWYLICHNNSITFTRWWVREVNVPNLGVTDQYTVALIEVIIWDALLILLNDGVSYLPKCIVLLQRRFDTLTSWLFHLWKAIFQPWNWLWLQIRYHCKAERMLCSGKQYNTPHFQVNPKMYGLQNISNFLWGLYKLSNIKQWRQHSNVMSDC